MLYQIQPRRTLFMVTLALAVLTLALPQPAEAQFIGYDFEPSKYERHVACNEAWRASHAYKQQQCYLRSVHWDSYHTPGGWSHFLRSNCWIHIECKFGSPHYKKGQHLGKLAYLEVHKLRRCKDDPSVVNTSCNPLTNEEVNATINYCSGSLNTYCGPQSNQQDTQNSYYGWGYYY